MLELIQVIALLCQVSTGRNDHMSSVHVDKQQLKCQQWYLECVYEDLGKLNAEINMAVPGGTHLRKCINKRAIK